MIKLLEKVIWVTPAWLLCLTGCGLNRNQPDGSGTIECTQVQVSPQVAGRVLKFPHHEGAVLKQGEVVAQLDTIDYGLKRDEVRAALAQAEAQLELMRAGSRDEDIQRAKAQAQEARTAAKLAEADLLRIQKVYELKSATQKQLDDAKAQAERTAAALTSAEQNLARIVNGNRKEEIRIAQALADQAKVKLAQAEKALADCTITAPMNGVVTVRSREEGEMVNAGSSLLTLSRLDEVWLSIYLAESRLGRVKLGQGARVKIDGDNKYYPGTVTFISSEAEFTPKNVQTPDERAKLVYRVKITLPNAEGIFKPGMTADGYLGTAQ